MRWLIHSSSLLSLHEKIYWKLSRNFLPKKLLFEVLSSRWSESFHIRPNRKSVDNKIGNNWIYPNIKIAIVKYFAVMNHTADGAIKTFAMRKVIPAEVGWIERRMRHTTNLQWRTDIQVLVQWRNCTLNFAGRSVGNRNCSVFRLENGGVTTKIQHHPDILLNIDPASFQFLQSNK